MNNFHNYYRRLFRESQISTNISWRFILLFVFTRCAVFQCVLSEFESVFNTFWYTAIEKPAWTFFRGILGEVYQLAHRTRNRTTHHITQTQRYPGANLPVCIRKRLYGIWKSPVIVSNLSIGKGCISIQTDWGNHRKIYGFKRTSLPRIWSWKITNRITMDRSAGNSHLQSNQRQTSDPHQFKKPSEAWSAGCKIQKFIYFSALRPG